MAMASSLSSAIAARGKYDAAAPASSPRRFKDGTRPDGMSAEPSDCEPLRMILDEIRVPSDTLNIASSTRALNLRQLSGDIWGERRVLHTHTQENRHTL